MFPVNSTIPYQKRANVTLALIGLCIACYLYELSLTEAQRIALVEHYALVPKRLLDGHLTPLLTSMFLHGGLLHIVSNLWTLWVFGPALEDRLGPARYAALYLGGGIAAGLLHALFNWGSAVPALGASGAIAAVIAAFARRFPYAWVNVFQPIGIIPAFFLVPGLVFALGWFAIQVGQGSLSVVTANGAGVAWWAHVGGFALGWWLQPRITPPSPATREAADAAASMLWPWTLWQRWWLWWLGRR